MSKLRPRDHNNNGFESIRGTFQAYWNEDKDGFILIENCLMTNTIPNTATTIKILANSRTDLPDIGEDDTIITLYLRDVEEFKNEAEEHTASGKRIFFANRIEDTGQKITTPYTLRIRKKAFFYYQETGNSAFTPDQFENLKNVPEPKGLAIRSSSPKSSHNASTPGNTTKSTIRLFPPKS